MKIRTALLTLSFLLILGACNNPIIIPADLAVTLPPNQDFILHATQPVEVEAPAVSPQTPPSVIETATPIPTTEPTQTPTQTRQPTRKSPYPVAQATPLIDMGFQPISMENLPQIGVVFNAITTSRRHTAISVDGQKLFMSTSTGLFLFDRQGQVLAHWPNIFTPDISCESCISANSDGSRVALMTRNAGSWQAQLYAIQGDQATLLMALPAEINYLGIRNEASIAISPDDTLLAFKAGTSLLRVLDLKTKLQVLGYDRSVTGITFTPDGTSFVIHGGQEMLFYNVNTWKAPSNLLLPREDTPFAFSADGKLLAIALPTKMRVYSVEKLNMLREINVPPSNADQRQWQIAFKQNNLLVGYAIRWDTFHTSATVETGQWDIETGITQGFETSASASPDALVWFWGADLPLPSTLGELESGPFEYPAFRFVSEALLLVNSPHSACWLKLFTGESTCFKDPDHLLFATDGTAFIEKIDNSSTSLVDRAGKTSIQTGPYRIAAVNRTGEWALINTGTGTDLYRKGKELPEESVQGQPQGFAENTKYIVFTALEKENTFTFTLVDKTSHDTIYQKTDNFLYKPLLMTIDNSIYYMQNEMGLNQTIINVINPKTLQVNELMRLSLPATPQTLALSSTNLFAIGQKDGSVLLMTLDGAQTAVFQAAASAISGLDFSADGHFLAVASAEGVRIYAIFPNGH